MTTHTKTNVLVLDDRLDDMTSVFRELGKTKTILLSYADKKQDAETQIDQLSLAELNIVIVDMKWRTADRTGISLIKRIREKQGNNVKIIAISNYSDLLTDAISAGADCVLQKQGRALVLRDIVLAFAEIYRPSFWKLFHKLLLSLLLVFSLFLIIASPIFRSFIPSISEFSSILNVAILILVSSSILSLLIANGLSEESLVKIIKSLFVLRKGV